MPASLFLFIFTEVKIYFNTNYVLLLNLCLLGHKRNKLCLHPHLCRNTVELIGVCPGVL